MSSVLSILEVSQKQAYIFAGNELKGNVDRSEEIAWVTSPAYFTGQVPDSGYQPENLVYAGGGHTVLEFSNHEAAVRFNEKVTARIMADFPEMEVFAKIEDYDEGKKPSENLKNLIAALEVKKSVRRASFHQGTFGLEKIDSNTLEPVAKKDASEKEGKKTELQPSLTPAGYQHVYKFGDLGGSRESSNFIAVVHIDGNGMGKRVEDFYASIDSLPWPEFKKRVAEFSEEIDVDFKAAFKEMNEEVAWNLEHGELKEELSLRGKNFPVRRIITSGDDICFVTEGRIGIECARIFVEKLCAKKNKVDGQGYAACAGVAIVHQKYPFYRAYDLAEKLCSNAKSFGAMLSTEDNGRAVSSIDWHIEFGEIPDSIGELRAAYKTSDAKHLELRPYIIHAPEEILKKEPSRQYKNFRSVYDVITSKSKAYARSSVKQLRMALKNSEDTVRQYITFHKLDGLLTDCYKGIFTETDTSKVGSGVVTENRIFLKTADGEDRSFLFDAIEIMDTFVPLAGKEAAE